MTDERVPAMEKVEEWLQQHAPAALSSREAPASPEEIAAVETALRAKLPADLIAMWSRHGGRIPIFEYAGLGPTRALEARESLEALRRDGAFEGHELFPDSSEHIQRVKWHTKWLPIAQDGGGNLYCVDLAPGPRGKVGQVIRWEVRGGASAEDSVSLAELFARYAEALSAFTYDELSGTFDGPFVDLLAST